MMISCPCDRWHDLSPTAMAIVIHAYSTGLLQQVTGKGVKALCITEAFQYPEILDDFRKRYNKHTISIDGVNLTKRDTAYVAMLDAETQTLSAETLAAAAERLERERAGRA